jgi:formamidase
MTEPEVRDRATINGAIAIGRAPGVIPVRFLAPLSRLDAAGLGDYAREQHNPDRNDMDATKGAAKT